VCSDRSRHDLFGYIVIQAGPVWKRWGWCRLPSSCGTDVEGDDPLLVHDVGFFSQRATAVNCGPVSAPGEWLVGVLVAE
jgi:hypothetical protein